MRLSLFASLALVALGACGPSQTAPPVAESAMDDAGARVNDKLTLASQPVQERVVLKDASLLLIVPDPTEKLSSITRMAEEMGGWVVSSQSQKVASGEDQEVIRISATIRIPAARFNEALNQIKTGVTSVESEAINGQDVTQDYVDLQSQLTNLQASEEQLQTIMESARTVEDVLSVQDRLTQVHGEVERVQGRIRYYEESAAFSSISVQLIPEASPNVLATTNWNPGNTVQAAFSVLVTILRAAADILIVVAVIGLPLVLIFGIPGWFLRRFLQRKIGTTIPKEKPEP